MFVAKFGTEYVIALGPPSTVAVSVGVGMEKVGGLLGGVTIQVKVSLPGVVSSTAVTTTE